jgi:hypothetical protein
MRVAITLGILLGGLGCGVGEVDDADRGALATVEASVSEGPVVTETISVPSSGQEVRYYVNYEATLADQGYLKNVRIAVRNPTYGGARAVSRYFHGPGRLAATLAAGTNDVLLTFTKADGTVESSIVKESIFTVTDCIDINGKYRACIDLSSSTESGFGSNLAKLRLYNFSLPAECGGFKVASSLIPARKNRRFQVYYFPNTFEDANIDPISSLTVVTRNGRTYLELVGRYAVYGNSVNPGTTTELLDVRAFERLEYIGGCRGESGPLSG